MFRYQQKEPEFTPRQERILKKTETIRRIMSEGPWADEVPIGDLPIRIGQLLTFLYDFGDRWRISVALEEVDTDMELDEPVILKSQVEPPEQYPDWNDEDEWE